MPFQIAAKAFVLPFDTVFALMFKPNEDVDMPRDVLELEDALAKALDAWQKLKKTNQDGHKNIPPKVHALVQHLLDQFQEYGGIGDFDEQFVECSHQSGKRDMFRSRAIRCRHKKYGCFAKWEEVRSDPNVVAKSEAVKNNRKRKFKGTRKPSKKMLTSNNRAANRAAMISEFVPKDLETAAELTLREIDLGNANAEVHNGNDDN
jgi:hypothetical protein